jgi:hypothetical protein
MREGLRREFLRSDEPVSTQRPEPWVEAARALFRAALNPDGEPRPRPVRLAGQGGVGDVQQSRRLLPGRSTPQRGLTGARGRHAMLAEEGDP